MTLKKTVPTLPVHVYQIPSRQKQTEYRERAEKRITRSRLLFLASPTNCKTTVDMEFLLNVNESRGGTVLCLLKLDFFLWGFMYKAWGREEREFAI